MARGTFKLENLLKHVPATLAVFDREMNYVMASSRWIELFDLDANIVGQNHYNLFPEMPERWREVHQLGFAGETVRADEDLFQRANGRIYWLRWEVAPWLQDDGSVGGIVISCEDITAWKQLTQELDATQRRLTAIMAAAPVGISYSDDPSCERITGNEALLKQFNISAEDNISASAPDPDAPGRQVRFFYQGREILDRDLPLQRAVAERKEIPPFELEILQPNGKRWVALASGAPIFGPGDEVLGGVAVTIDITERQKMEQTLREADRRKDEFIALLGHELRNPLSPVSYGVQILRTMVNDKNGAQMLTIMDRQLQHLVRLVDDLLEISRINKGKLELKIKDVDLRDIVRDAIHFCRPTINDKGHNLKISMPSYSLPLFGDPTRLVQIINNLLLNASKYTDCGGLIELNVSKEGKFAILSVRDNGMGLAKEMLESVFDPFIQVEGGGKAGKDGLGIGLSLVRSLVSMHGGTVSAFSEGLGLGSEFTVRLPLASECGEVRERFG